MVIQSVTGILAMKRWSYPLKRLSMITVPTEPPNYTRRRRSQVGGALEEQGENTQKR